MKTKFSGILTLFLAFVVQFTFAQEKTVTGKVTDESGLPLPGATVLIKGTTTGVSTDFDGVYSIQANSGAVLRYSYVGYSNVEKTVGASSTIDVSLTPDSQLDEVVVTALGIKRKKDEVTTAYQEVKTEELVKANNPSVISSLSGKVSGLTITQNSNGVAGGTRIVLRGNRSISGNNEALIVIDGAISNTTFFDALDPNIIESVNVIKGAAGSALYGSQGSNGAIIVTTKKGSPGEKMTLNINTSVEFETVAYVPERQTRYGQGWDLGNGFENIIYENGGWGAEFDGQIAPVGLPQADGTFIMRPYSTLGDDNIKEFFETGFTRQNSFQLTGGNDNGYFRLGGRNVNTEFVIKNDDRKRNTFTLGAGQTIGKWSANGNVIYTNTSATYHNGDLYRQLLQTASNIPVKDFEFSGNEGHWNAYFTNPYWNRDNQRAESESTNITLSGDIAYTVNDNISIKLLSSARINDSGFLSYQNEYAEPQEIQDNTGADRSLPSSFTYNNQRSSAYYTDLFFNFDYMLTDDISFAANVGFNNQYFKSSFAQVGGTGLTIPGIYNSSNLSGGFDNAVTDDDRRSSARIGAFANLDFGYQDFLFLNVTGRNDWSSVLAKQNQSFFYPSASIAFLPTKAFDDFGGDILNYMKVTASVVKVGNDGGIAAYAIQPVFNQAPQFPIGGQNSFIADQSVFDPLLQPEFTNTYEVGVLFGFLKDRVTLDASYQNFNTTDQITNVAASQASGLDRTTINVGETKGTALELDLGFKILRSQDLKWNVNVGYSTTDNEVVKVSEQADQVSLGGFTGLAEVFAIEGEAFPVIQTNFYERDPQGRVLIDPANGNPIEGTGLKIAGRTTPKHIVNLNTSFTFKRFTFGATMDYRTGHVFYSDVKANMTWPGHAVETAQGGRGAFIFPNSAIETSPGVYETNTTVPSAGTTAGSYITWWGVYRGIGENNILDATAFKVRELSLRYDINPDYFKNTFITSLSLTATARNVFTVLPSENRGYGDPEAGFSTGNAQGIQVEGNGQTTASNYPATSTFGFGVNLIF